MNILSLFNGMSCLRLAMDNLGMKVDTYYSSEIDKYANKVTAHWWSDIIQIGDVRNVCAKDLKPIDLLVFGSPCQGFSTAGKGLNFQDERSALFFEAVRILNECREINPSIKFLMENVQMKQAWIGIISGYLGVFPVCINSALLTAQNRVRNYWTNIKTKKTGLFSEIYSDIPQPQDKGILLKDILQPESEVDEKYYLSETALKRILTGQLNADLGTIGCVNDRGKLRNIDKATNLDSNSFKGIDNHGQRTMVKQLNPSKESGGRQPYQQNRIYDINGKSPYMPEQLSGKSHKINTERLRRLTLNECCRLQGVPDNFFNGIVSDTQAYKMLGNGFTVPVIEHILKFL